MPFTDDELRFVRWQGLDQIDVYDGRYQSKEEPAAPCDPVGELAQPGAVSSAVHGRAKQSSATNIVRSSRQHSQQTQLVVT
jgi:hypothetical protein